MATVAAMFKDYLMACNFPDGEKYADRKAALLRASPGIEGFRIFTSMTPKPKAASHDREKCLAGHFDRKPSLKSAAARLIMGIDLFETLCFKMINPAGATISAVEYMTSVVSGATQGVRLHLWLSAQAND